MSEKEEIIDLSLKKKSNKKNFGLLNCSDVKTIATTSTSKCRLVINITEDNNIFVIDNENVYTYNGELLKKYLYDLMYISPYNIINATKIDLDEIESKFHQGIFNGISLNDYQDYLINLVGSMTYIHYEYSNLAGNIGINILKKRIIQKGIKSLLNFITVCKNQLDEKFVQRIFRLEKYFIIDERRDYIYNYSSFNILKDYLMKNENGEIIETPQYMFMRTAFAICMPEKDDFVFIDHCKRIYYDLSVKNYIHGSPTLYNAGRKKNQMSSCFLLNYSPSDDSIFYRIENILMMEGGIGLAVHKLTKNQFFPVIKKLNDIVENIHKNKKTIRPGSITIYMEVWNINIIDFINLRRNLNDSEDKKSRNIFTALWIPNLFMRRVMDDEEWTLMDPEKNPLLDEFYGLEFINMYRNYEIVNLGCKKIRARELWENILKIQIENGLPFLCFKDTINNNSLQNHLGVIKCSNLCTEIMQYCSDNETAVCNLASISLPSIVIRDFLNNNSVSKKLKLDYRKLYRLTKDLVKNLNYIIDNNYYPDSQSKYNNLHHRPIGIGVQGFADLLMILKLPFDSIESKEINKNIFKIIYYAALNESCELARIDGTFQSYKNSPYSKGIINTSHFSLEEKIENEMVNNLFLDWKNLKKKIKIFGLRNSLMTTVMPTVSTSQIIGNYDSIEPISNNIYIRRTISGEYIILNKYLIDYLESINLWNRETYEIILRDSGSVKNLNITNEFKNIFKNIWEISDDILLQYAIDRLPYIDQSQSLNIYMTDPTIEDLHRHHMIAWGNEIKTSMYYLRTKPTNRAIPFTLDKNVFNIKTEEQEECCMSCTN